MASYCDNAQMQYEAMMRQYQQASMNPYGYAQITNQRAVSKQPKTESTANPLSMNANPPVRPGDPHWPD